MLMIPMVILTIDSDTDRAYMTALYRQHHALMLKTAWGYVRSKEDVEDVVSESCAKLIEKLDDLRGMERGPMRSYIVTVVRHTAIDFQRKQKRANATFVQSEDATEQVPDHTSVEEKILLRDELNRVRLALHELPEKERDVLRMRYQQGMPDNEIAQAIGVSESSVRKYVMRGRQHLKMSVYEGETT